MRIAVIVPAYQPGKELDVCIEALLAQEHTADGIDIVVVDNGSTPPVEPRWGPRVRVITETQPGSYNARNAGIAATDAELLAFTDADCVPSPGWLEAGLTACRAGSSVVTGPVRLFGGSPPTAAELYEFKYAFPGEAYLAEGFGVTANLFVRRLAIDGGGMFDGGLRSGGDREFGQRLLARGFRTDWAEGAVVAHPARRTLSELVAKARRTAGGVVELERRRSSGLQILLRSLWLLRPPIRALVKILSDSDYDRASRCKIVSVVLTLRVAVCIERVRIMAGGEASR